MGLTRRDTAAVKDSPWGDERQIMTSDLTRSVEGKPCPSSFERIEMQMS
jgi:hypothetical protein